MKITLASLLVGGAGLVAAIPLRLIVVERIGPVTAPRIGLAGSEAFNPPAAIDLTAAQVPDREPGVNPEMFVSLPNAEENPFAPTFIPARPKHHDCGKKKNIVMAKMDDFSKFFRKIFGFSPIDEFDLPLARHSTEHHRMLPPPKMMAAHAGPDEDDNKFHILPFMPGPVRSEGFPPGSDEPSNPASRPHPIPTEFRGRHRMWIHRHRPHSFIGRLHKAFLTLSPWEGRALSFVVGCGIGVLLRMLYVFSVLAYRCFLAQPRLRLEDRQEEEHAPAADATDERQPLAQAPPPEYNEKGGSQ